MKIMRKSTDPRQALLVDYSAARARAIRWLGDRYLLAKPINASRYSRPQPASPVMPAARSS
jgi:hypothetical protein